MELWIRSQDKSILTRVNEININYKEPTKIICNHYFYGEQYENYIFLGEYATKKRALEVLDEIQKLLQPQILCKKGKIVGSFDNTIIREADGFEIKELSTYVYEMPEE